MISIGDTVQTTKGCRAKGPGGNLKVIDTDRKWVNHDACLCEKESGKTGLYLTKNLIPVNNG